MKVRVLVKVGVGVGLKVGVGEYLEMGLNRPCLVFLEQDFLLYSNFEVLLL